MNVIDPEVRVGVPLLSRVAQNGFSAAIDEGDLERLGIGVENDRVERVHEVSEVLCRSLRLSSGGLLGREETIVVDRGSSVVGQADQDALVRVAERPWCSAAHVEETLDLLSDDDGDGES